MLLPAPYICAMIAHMYEFSKRDHTVIYLPTSITRSSLFWYTLLLFTEFSAFLTLDSIR